MFWKTFFREDRLKNFCEDLSFFFFFFFFEDRLKNFCEDLFFFFLGEHLASERLSLALALASDFFCVLGLGLEPSVLDSTSAVYRYNCALAQQFGSDG